MPMQMPDGMEEPTADQKPQPKAAPKKK